MISRKELQPPDINEELLSIVEELIDSIDVQLEEDGFYINEEDEIAFYENKTAEEINAKLVQLKKFAKKDISAMEFYHYWNHSSLEDVAKELIMPEPPYLNDITKEELTEVINEFFTLENIEDFHESYYIELLEKSFGLNDISNYIFYPDLKGIEDEPLKIAEKIIEDSKKKCKLL